MLYGLTNEWFAKILPLSDTDKQELLKRKANTLSVGQQGEQKALCSQEGSKAHPVPGSLHLAAAQPHWWPRGAKDKHVRLQHAVMGTPEAVKIDHLTRNSTAALWWVPVGPRQARSSPYMRKNQSGPTRRVSPSTGIHRATATAHCSARITKAGGARPEESSTAASLRADTT